MSSEEEEKLEWNHVVSIILTDPEGYAHNVSKEDLIKMIKPYIQDALTRLWEDLIKERY